MVEITTEEFNKLSDYIKKNYGIYLKKEKMTLVSGRLFNVLKEAGCDSFSQYYEHIIKDKTGLALITLVNRITTNHTFFMRESSHFFYFRDHILPLLKNTVKDKDMRLWCAACSSGEESYTLAMIIDEFLGGEKFWWDTKILATDISQEVLDRAKEGIYSNERLAPLPIFWKTNYFKQIDAENSIVVDKIKQEVVYRRFNLMEEIFPFKKKFHVIFCRNVMIYFDNDTKENLIDKLYDCLEYGGYLFVGHSESLNRDKSKFKYIMPSVYRKL